MIYTPRLFGILLSQTQDIIFCRGVFFTSTLDSPAEEDKAFNTALSRCRIAIEHVNREIKIFRICKETYRGKGARGLIRVKLVASLYNHRCGF